ncbi:MAG: ammonium transporter [Deltaproteobacteria bacterium]|nr:MAG: ammonium transporter [Deltaproteobacteria bacterium]
MEAADVKLMLDTVWVLLCAALVFFMNAGFGCVESGLARSKNTVNILAKNFIVFGFGVIGYWAVGYGLMFGGGSGFAGTEGWLLSGLDAEPGSLPLAAVFFFQLCFAVTAATIVSGAVAERIHIKAFLVFSVVLTTAIYPIVGHWVWGADGWLAARGFTDFAGSTVVHSVGGWAALAGAMLLGPRLGKYSATGAVQPIPGHSMPLVFLGGMILWLGWFGFNAGSQLAADPEAIAHICATTALAASFGTVSATLWSYVRAGKPDLTLIVNGMLGGLVGVTAGCSVVELEGAAAIGAIAGVLVIEAVMWFDRVRIDDPVGATSVHLVCGVFGTLMVGVFGHRGVGGFEGQGLVYGGGLAQLGTQALGAVAVGAFVFPIAVAVWFALKRTIGIRVSEEDELAGLDLAEHGMEAYPEAPERDSRLAAALAREAAPDADLVPAATPRG